MSDRDLTPAQEESVRALLASARHTEPAPAHVVARLDETLADLVSQRREERAPVVTLASRRRRLTSSVLLAAAAVVVVGVGITQVLPPATESSGDSAGSSAESLEEPTTTQSDRSYDAEAPGSPESSGPGTDESQRSTQDKELLTGSSDADMSALTSSSPFKSQVRALRSSPSFSVESSCPIPDAGSAAQVAMTYEGRPGVLVYRAPAAGRQQVDAYLCGVGEPLRSVRIRAR